MKAEYKALTDTTSEFSWLQSLFWELGLPLYTLLTLWCYNIRVVYLSANLVFHAHIKHVEIDFHFVCENVACYDLQVQFIDTYN